MTYFTCPICTTQFNDDDHVVAERLSALNYMHLDIWVKCPKCKYTPCFGRELSDSKPIYWKPEKLPLKFRRNVEAAILKYTPPLNCPLCPSKLELHKIWIHTWKKGEETHAGNKVYSTGSDDVKAQFQFFAPSVKGKLTKYFIPAGILTQFKCVNFRCKYVRYITL